MREVTATIFDDAGGSIEVQGVYCKGLKGARDQWGQQLEPDDEPAIEIVRATNEDGSERELDEEEARKATESLWWEFMEG